MTGSAIPWAAEMARLAAPARVGERVYTKELLAEALSGCGFAVDLMPTWERRGLFVAERSRKRPRRSSPGEDRACQGSDDLAAVTLLDPRVRAPGQRASQG